MRLCFHIAVVHHLKINILAVVHHLKINILAKQKGIFKLLNKVLSNDKHLHEHFIMIRTISLIELLFIFIIKMYRFAV